MKKHWVWVVPLATVVLGFFGWIGKANFEVDKKVALLGIGFKTTQSMCKESCAESKEYIDKFFDVKTNTKQNDNIEINTVRIGEMRSSLRWIAERLGEVEILQASLGGPSDPLYSTVQKMEQDLRREIKRVDLEVTKLRNHAIQ